MMTTYAVSLDTHGQGALRSSLKQPGGKGAASWPGPGRAAGGGRGDRRGRATRLTWMGKHATRIKAGGAGSAHVVVAVASTCFSCGLFSYGCTLLGGWDVRD